MGDELEPCPRCGALPCDWTDNPHTRPAERDAEGWLPIESAPKDNSVFVDLWTSLGERVTDASWNPDRQRWEHWSIGGFDSMEWVRIDGQATHWRPLPAPPLPTSAQDSAEGVS